MNQLEHDVVVVGAGPNGLAAAVTLARAGLTVRVFEAQETVGGGARTVDSEMAAGIKHDVCSAVHPLALASPFFTEFDLPARGVELRSPRVSYAHPITADRAAIAYRSLADTVEHLGTDGGAWRRLFGPLTRNFPDLVDLALGPMRPDSATLNTALKNPVGVQFALRVVRQSVANIRQSFATDSGAALFAGVTAHASTSLPALIPSGIGLMLGAAAHVEGWPIPVNGSQAITQALVDDLAAHGGDIVTGRPIASENDLPPARAYLFDTSPQHFTELFAHRLPENVVRMSYRQGRGSGIAKVDFVLNGPIPWKVPEIGDAATAHLGGTAQEVYAAEKAIMTGQHADHPVVLTSDPTVGDRGREVDGRRPLWTYAHVPQGSPRNMTEAVIRQIERFAPEFRDVIEDSRHVPASQLSLTNANYIGGNISGGDLTLRRMLLGNRRWDPYATGLSRMYICSAATPPGPGVHGMAGWNAAKTVLKQQFQLPTPNLSPTS